MAAGSFDDAVRALRAGEPVAFPTDTVYGIGVAVAWAEGPGALFEAKGRPAGKPIPWLVGGVDDLARYGAEVPGYAAKLAEEGWPGPLTLVVRASGAVPEAFRSDAGTIALRMPACDEALALVRAVGCPLATTSANLSGCEPPRRFADIDSGLLGACACALEGAQACSGTPSTIVDCTGTAPVRLR